MPNDPAEIHILDTIAVQVDLILVRKAFNLLGNAALGTVPLVEEGRNDDQDRLWHDEQSCFALCFGLSLSAHRGGAQAGNIPAVDPFPGGWRHLLLRKSKGG